MDSFPKQQEFSEKGETSDQVPSPDEISRLMQQEGRGRRRIVTVLFVGMGLIVYSWFLLCVCSLIMSTDVRSVVPFGLLLNGVLACFAAVPVGLLFTIGYLVGRACLRHSRRWVAAGFLPALLGVVVIGLAVRHRLDSGVVFHDILGCDLPVGARDVSHTYEGPIIEEYAEVSFSAERREIVKLLEELGLEPDPAAGFQTFDSVPCEGDWAKLTVDWSTGRVSLDYMDV